MIIGYNKIKCLLIAGVTFLLLISPNMSLQAQSVSEKKAKAYMVADAAFGYSMELGCPDDHQRVCMEYHSAKTFYAETLS